jgi:eukaryotic-like serine/threonine-protein kinase
MGEVYRADDLRLGHAVCLKFLSLAPAQDKVKLRRFLREVRLARQISHPNVCRVHDIGESDGHYYISMAYIDGENLASLLRRVGRLPIDKALAVAHELCAGLAAAHDQGILHLDLKPANVMVDGRGRAIITDFGIALPAEAALRGSRAGTPAYMAPEQREGRELTIQTDLFALGLVLYEAFTGRHARGSPTNSLNADDERETVRPSQFAQDIAPSIERTILACLAYDPGDRPRSAIDVSSALPGGDRLADAIVPPTVSSDRAGLLGRLLAYVGLSNARMTRRRSVAVAVAGVAAAVGLAWISGIGFAGRASPQHVLPTAVRLTTNAGLTLSPVISRDGTLIAYSSDKAGPDLDIWVQQTSGETAIRLTGAGTDDGFPSFSADGSLIAYEARRPLQDSIFVVPTLGGAPRLLVESGRVPRFSPDGRWLAYLLPMGAGVFHVYVVPAAGGTQRRLASELLWASWPVWSPDSTVMVVLGRHVSDTRGMYDFFVIPVDGRPVIPLNLAPHRPWLPKGAGVSYGMAPLAWDRDGSRILFHEHVGDTRNIWQVRVESQGWRAIGEAERVTFGHDDEESAAVSERGQLVYTSYVRSLDLWTLPIDADQGVATGPLKRMFTDAADDQVPRLSQDGRWLAYTSQRQRGAWHLRLRDLLTGKEQNLATSEWPHDSAISPDGRRIAFSLNRPNSPILLTSTGGTIPHEVCKACGSVSQWSPDGRSILYWDAEPGSSGNVYLLDLESRGQVLLVRDEALAFRFPLLSADGRWLLASVVAKERPNPQASQRVMIVPIQRGKVAARDQWITIADQAVDAQWSSRGSAVSYRTLCDGVPCVSARRVHPVTKRPSDAPTEPVRFGTRNLSPVNVNSPAIAVARDRLIISLGDQNGDVWMVKLAASRKNQ